ncbi:unnamed protein product, partial [Brassica rapa subsp. trilocularis]
FFLFTFSRNSESPNAVSLKGDFRRFSLIDHSHRRGNPSAHSLRGVSLNSAAGKDEHKTLSLSIYTLVLFSRLFLPIYNRYVEGDYIFSEFSGKKNGYTRTPP